MPLGPRLVFWLPLVAVAALSFWLRAAFPLHALGPLEHDDFLFIRLAGHLRHGDWLGPYDHLTLTKGMFYPLFIAGASLVHIPLKAAEQIVYLVAAAGFSALIANIARNRILGILLFAGLALNPVLWTVSLARVIRDALYIGLSLGLFALVAAAFSSVLLAKSVVRSMALAFAAGLVGAAFWLTREEGPWILPALCVLAAFAAYAYRIDRRTLPFWRPGAPRAAVPCLIVGCAVAVASVLAVAAMNRGAYGIFTDVEVKAPGFVAAYGALNRVKADRSQAQIVVPREVREQVYRVSPSAAQLRPLLEGERGAMWRAGGCPAEDLARCPDIRAGWFIWALRDAALLTGHHRSGAEAEAFYSRLADEIDMGCAAGALNCLPPRKTLRPPFHLEDGRKALAMSETMAKLLLRWGDSEILSRANVGSPERLAAFRALVGPVEAPDTAAPIARIHGWVAVPGGSVAVAIVDESGKVRSETELHRAPDVDNALQGRGLFSRRFSSAPACPTAKCALQISLASGAVRRVPLESLADPPAGNSDYVLTIEAVERAIGARQTDQLRKRDRIQRLARGISRAYAFMTPPLLVTACLGLVLSALCLRRDPRMMLVSGIALAALAAVGARVGLLSYLEVTSFPSLNMLYLASATPFVVIVVGLGNWLVVESFVWLAARYGAIARRVVFHASGPARSARSSVKATGRLP